VNSGSEMLWNAGSLVAFE